MNNVDKDIEQFEKNLIEINMMKEQISDLSESLKKIVKETADINQIKTDINKEIVSLNKTAEESEKKFTNRIQSLKDIASDVKNSIEKDKGSIITPLSELFETMSTKLQNNIKLANDNLNKLKETIIKNQEKNNQDFLILKIIIILNIIFTFYIVLTIK